MEEGTSTMPNEQVGKAEFNAGMKGIRDAVEGLTERVAALESLNRAQLMAEIGKARAEGEAEGRRQAQIAELQKRVDKQSNTVLALLVAFGGQLLWWAFSKLTSTK